MNAYTKQNWGAGMFAGKVLQDGAFDTISQLAYAEVGGLDDDGGEWSQEQELQQAILLDAIQTIRDPSPQKAQQRKLDILWMREDQAGDCCSFTAICESLGLDPCAVRKVVLAQVGQVESPYTRQGKLACPCCGTLTRKGYCRGAYEVASRIAQGRPGQADIEQAIEHRKIMFERRRRTEARRAAA